MLKNRRYSEFFFCTANITFHTANRIAGTPNNIHICIPLSYLLITCHQQLFTSETNFQICLKNYFFNNTKNKAKINKTTNMINPENIIISPFFDNFPIFYRKNQNYTNHICWNFDKSQYFSISDFIHPVFTFILSQNQSQILLLQNFYSDKTPFT